MSLITGIHRNQTQIYCLNDEIKPDSEARLIDAFVNWIDLVNYNFVIKGNSKEGHPAYAVKDLLKLYFYGYINRTRSSRRLMWLCETNLEVKWLLNNLVPSHTSINNFRKQNGKQFIKVFRAFNRFLRDQNLFHHNTVATDGSKFRAQNSKKNNYNQKKIQRHLNYIDNQTQLYLEELDKNDKIDNDKTKMSIRQNIKNKLKQLDKRREKYQTLENLIHEAHKIGETQISTSDPDARALPKKMNIVEVAYNVITTVEAKNKFITNFEVSNKIDTYALSTAGRKAKVALGLNIHDHLIQLADKGFDTGFELKLCSLHNIVTLVAPKKRGKKYDNPAFNTDKFQYNIVNDSYYCPMGMTLTSNGKYYIKNNQSLKKSYSIKRYVAEFNKCNTCIHKMHCAKENNIAIKRGRSIERSEYQDYVDQNIQRVNNNKELYKKRQQIVEHPYGTIKRQWGFDYTLLKGINNVAGEFALIFTSYNLRRAINFFGVKELIKRLNKAFEFFFYPIFACFKNILRFFYFLFLFPLFPFFYKYLLYRPFSALLYRF